MSLFLKLQSNSYAVVDHQTEVFEKRAHLRIWLISLLDGFDYLHIRFDGNSISAPMGTRRNNSPFSNPQAKTSACRIPAMAV